MTQSLRTPSAITTLTSTSLAAVLLSVVGCGGPTTNGTADMASAGGGLTLKNVPTGCPTSETAADLYTSVVMNTCAIDTCHGKNGSTSFSLSAAADMHTKWVGVNSSLYSSVGMPYVTANNLNTSFLMYKLTGSQGKYGSQMPNTGIPLSSAQLCKFVAWINSGAPSQ